MIVTVERDTETPRLGWRHLAAVETLRREGYNGRLTLVGDEPAPPYDRPLPSKQVLAGTWDLARTTLRAAGHYAGLGVDLVTGRPAKRVAMASREVILRLPVRLGWRS